MPAVYGEDYIPISGFSGLNDGLTPEFIEDRQLATANNFLLQEDGSIRKRFPLERYTSLTAGAGSFPAVFPVAQLLTSGGFTGDSWTLLHEAPGRHTYSLHDLNPSTSLIAGLEGIIVYDAVQYNGLLYLGCEDGVYQWGTSGTATKITGAPAGFRRILTFRDRIFGIVGDSLYWCAPGDASSWPVENILAVNPRDGSELTGMQIYGDSLILTKSRSWWALHFADDPLFWFLRGVNDSVGCHGPRALKMCENLLYFIDHKGLWVTDTVTFTLLFNLSTEDSASERGLSFDIMAHHVSVYKDWIIFYVKGYGTRAFRFRSPRGFTTLSWIDQYFWTPIFEQGSFTSPSNWLVSNGNYLYRFVPFGTAGSEIVSCQMVSKAYDLARTSRTKQLMRGTLNMRGPGLSSTCQYRWRKDEQLYDAYRSIPPNSRNSTSQRLQAAGRARTFQLDVIETSNEYFAIHGFNMVSQLEHDQSNLQEAE